MVIEQLTSSLNSIVATRHTHIESTAFRLACRLSAIFLLVALFVVSSTAFVSKPIFCDLPRGKVNQELLNAHCYTHSTYRVVKWFYLEDSEAAMAARENATDDAVLEPWPGIRPKLPGDRDASGGGFIQTYKLVYAYFNWIWLIYFLMAIGFYLPNWVWKMLEGGRLKTLISKIDYFDKEKDSDASKLTIFAQYMEHSLGNYGSYMRRYFFCEALVLVNIALQMFILNRVLHGRWYLYGYETVALYWGKRYTPKLIAEDANPMVLLFPKQTKCEYRRFGPSGNLDLMDALCIMPLNNFNDKFFLLFWFWIAFLLVTFVCTILYRLPQYCCTWLRYRAIKSMIAFEYDSKRIFKCDLMALIEEITIADWFVLYHMGANLDPLSFYEALAALIALRKSRHRMSRTTRNSRRMSVPISKYVNNLDEIPEEAEEEK